jgi:lysophospholipase L1-like esterase
LAKHFLWYNAGVRVLSWVVVPVAVLATLAVTVGCSGGGSSSRSEKRKDIVYVSLGDSYSSGEGAPPYLDDAADPKSCQRSPHGWTALLAEDAPRVRSHVQLACSSATTAYLTGPWTARHLPAQIPAAPDPKVTLVTLTIGGNDMGFGGIVASCYLFDCSPVPTSGEFALGLQQLSARLSTTVYPALRKAYPNARIVHVGYPRLTPATGTKVEGCAWLTTGEQAAAERIVTLIDSTFRAAARRSETAGGANVAYLDLTNALRGHELCSGSSWLRPVTIGGQATAHPTAAGQRAMERVVLRDLGLAPAL